MGPSVTPASLLSLLRDLRVTTVQLLGEIEANDFHRPLEPSGWTVLELVTHLTRDDEHYWFATLVDGEPSSPLTVATPCAWPTGHHGPVPVSKDDACTEYLHAIAASEAALAGRDLDGPTGWLDPTVPPLHQPRTIKDVLALAVLEYSMHVGHLEAAAEVFSHAGRDAEHSVSRSSGRGDS